MVADYGASSGDNRNEYGNDAATMTRRYVFGTGDRRAAGRSRRRRARLHLGQVPARQQLGLDRR